MRSDNGLSFKKSRLKVLYSTLSFLVPCTIYSAFLLSFLGRWNFLCEMLCSFRVQCCAVLLAMTTVYLVARKWKQMAFSACLMLIGLITIIPLYVRPSNTTSPVAASFRVMVWNVSEHNREFNRFLQFRRESGADLIVLTEIGDDWLDRLKSLDGGYHLAHNVTPNPRFKLALLCRLPIAFVSADELPQSRTGPAPWRVHLEIAGRPLTVIVSHPVSPTSTGHFSFRNAQYRDLATAAKACQSAVMIAGDLNGTSWSPHFQDLLRETGLRDSRRGFGIQATFPTFAPMVRVPIDHCLIDPAMNVSACWVGPDLGSDHFPILLDVTLSTQIPSSK